MTGFRDLGTLEGPLLLFGGPYSNAHALAALGEVARGLGIPATRMICTGDVCAYAAEPERTVTMMRALGCPVIAGNCEIALGNRAPDCGCGFDEGATCDRLSVEWYRHADAAVSEESRGWMRALPAGLLLVQGERRYAVIHGGADAVNRFVWPVDPAEVKAAQIAMLEAAHGRIDGVICGHTGIPFVEDVGRHRWINAGAIGLPPHDGDARTSYAVMDGETVTIHRLEYDHAGAAETMVKAGMTAGYHAALTSGWWPSEDSFPGAMRVGRTALG